LGIANVVRTQCSDIWVKTCELPENHPTRNGVHFGPFESTVTIQKPTGGNRANGEFSGVCSGRSVPLRL